MERKLSDFKLGDRVELVRSFYCDGDDRELDREIDARLRALAPGGRPVGEVIDLDRQNGYVRVAWDGSLDYVINPECLDLELQITPEDEEAAITSILQAIQSER